MNAVNLIGRVTRDIELRNGTTGTAIAKFSIAINRQYKKEGEERQADFISCVAFGKTAEFISKYFSKGSTIAIQGSIRTSKYEKEDGTKLYSTEVAIEKVHFAGSKSEKSNGNDAWQDAIAGEAQDEELPF